MNIFNRLLAVVLLTFCGLALAGQDGRVEELSVYDAVRKTLDQYAQSVVTADAKLMKQVFHPEAVSLGSFFGGDVAFSSPEGYMTFIENSPVTPAKVGENIKATVGFIKIDGKIASAEMQFANHWCSSGTNHLGLVEHEGRWKIITMLFWVRSTPNDVDTSKYPKGYCTADALTNN